MPFNEEELKGELVKTPELAAKILDLVKDTDAVKNHTKTISEQFFNENKSKEHGVAWSLVDKAFEDAGLKKPDGVKTSDYAAQIAKEKLQLQKEIDIYKAEKSGGNVDDKVKAIEAKYQKDKAEYEALYSGKLSEFEKQLTNERSTNQVQNNISKLSVEFGKLTFNPNIPKVGIDSISEILLAQLAKNATIENGLTVWNDAKGQPLKNQNHLNATTEEVLKSVFKDYIQVGTAGGNAQGTGATSKLEGNVLLLKNAAKITSKTIFASEFLQDWAAQGKTTNDKDFESVFAATKAKYNVDALPEK